MAKRPGRNFGGETMRLWHIALIPYLPRQQLLSQWRECVCIAKSLAEKGTPNHVLVNKILDYGSDQFLIYGEKVVRELFNRGYQVSYKSQHKFSEYNKQWRARRKQDLGGKLPKYAEEQEWFSHNLFGGWHTPRYLIQCLANLQEKHDCGAIPDNEWRIIEGKFREELLSMEFLEFEEASERMDITNGDDYGNFCRENLEAVMNAAGIPEGLQQKVLEIEGLNTLEER